MRPARPVRDTDSMVTEAKEESAEEDGDEFAEEDSVGADEGDEAEIQNEKVDEAFDEVLL
eukprot:JP444362.1.p2 GENE.JP444362.1~~JP444362.1.p2  ORF type:complete len:60 (-),score=21.87 JP444362.1:59-238(-)